MIKSLSENSQFSKQPCLKQARQRNMSSRIGDKLIWEQNIDISWLYQLTAIHDTVTARWRKWNGCSKLGCFVFKSHWARLPSRQMKGGRSGFLALATEYVTQVTKSAWWPHENRWSCYFPFRWQYRLQKISMTDFPRHFWDALVLFILLSWSLYRVLGICEWNVSLFWKPTLSPFDIQAPSSPPPSLIIRSGSKQFQTN